MATSTPRRTLRNRGKLLVLLGGSLALTGLFVSGYHPEQTALLWTTGLGGTACLLLFFVTERAVLLRAPGSRVARYGANSAVMTLAFLGILTLLNLLAVRHNETFDLTAEKLYTLSDQTLKVLRGLDQEVTVTAFFAEGTEERQEARPRLEDYAEATAQFVLHLVDPDKNPVLARQYGIREYGTTVFESGEQTYRVTEWSEEALTNGLVQATREGRKTICFLAGHGEHDPEDTQRGGYASAKKALTDKGYGVGQVLLLREGSVPANCEVLMVAGPTKPLLEAEQAALREYLERGGAVVLLQDPQITSGWEPLLAEWGVELRDDIVIDTVSRLFGGSDTTPILTDYPDHEITREFGLATFLPVARSLGVASPAPDGVTVQPLARTTPKSWGETDLSSDQASYAPDLDTMGPLVVAALAERPVDGGERPARLVVVGDSDFADNAHFDYSGNGDLLLNVFSYLAREDDLVAIGAKDTKPSPLLLSRAQGATLFYSSVVVAPLALVITGLSIWWRRRNL